MAVKRSVKQSSGAGVKLKPRQPSLYRVIMLNDDITTMDFVVEILRSIFDKSNTEAVELMMKVHREGRAEVARYPYDIAKTKQRQAMERARKEGFPFRIDIEEE